MIRQAFTAALAGFVLAGSPARAQQPPAPMVSVAPVQAAEIAPTVAVPGTVYSRNDARITAGVGGLLRFVAEPGTRVAAGDRWPKSTPRSYGCSAPSRKRC